MALPPESRGSICHLGFGLVSQSCSTRQKGLPLDGRTRQLSGTVNNKNQLVLAIKVEGKGVTNTAERKPGPF